MLPSVPARVGPSRPAAGPARDTAEDDGEAARGTLPDGGWGSAVRAIGSELEGLMEALNAAMAA